MHNHTMSQTDSIGAKLIDAIPIVGTIAEAFTNQTKTKYEVFDRFAREIATIAGSGVAMYLLPISIHSSQTQDDPDMSMDMSMDMNMDMDMSMAASMGLRMWVGDVSSKMIYAVLSSPAKTFIHSRDQQSFANHSLSEELKSLIPIIGSFITDVNSVSEALAKGTKENLEYFAMLSGGVGLMMVSPTGMNRDAASVSVSMSLMQLGMTGVMMGDILLKEGINKIKSFMPSFTLFGSKHHATADEEALLQANDGQRIQYLTM